MNIPTSVRVTGLHAAYAAGDAFLLAMYALNAAELNTRDQNVRALAVQAPGSAFQAASDGFSGVLWVLLRGYPASVIERASMDALDMHGEHDVTRRLVTTVKQRDCVDYPHRPGTLTDCPACEHRCHCEDSDLDGCVSSKCERAADGR